MMDAECCNMQRPMVFSGAITHLVVKQKHMRHKWHTCLFTRTEVDLQPILVPKPVWSAHPSHGQACQPAFPHRPPMAGVGAVCVSSPLLPNFETFMQIWISIVETVSQWHGRSTMADAFLSSRSSLPTLKTTGALPLGHIEVVRPEPTPPELRRKRQKPEQKQLLAKQALGTIVELEQQGCAIAWTDGCAKWHSKSGWVGGFGAVILGERGICNCLPPGTKQTINRAELMAVVNSFGSSGHKPAVSVDSELWRPPVQPPETSRNGFRGIERVFLAQIFFG